MGEKKIAMVLKVQVHGLRQIGYTCSAMPSMNYSLALLNISASHSPLQSSHDPLQTLDMSVLESALLPCLC